MSMPKRMRSTLASRAVRPARTSRVASLRLSLVATSMGDCIEDQSTLAPADAALFARLREVTKEILDSLTPREAKVLRMRFGIEMNTDHTLEEVGKQFDVT
ncbi:MAG: hypothetical protein E6Q94_03995, partial [Burkholderiaceae bacterium]